MEKGYFLERDRGRRRKEKDRLTVLFLKKAKISLRAKEYAYELV